MDENQALGALCKAMSVCPVHHKYVLADIKTMLIPAIRHRQYKFFEGAGQYGAITWAFLNAESAAKHIENKTPLTFDEWRSGNQFWIISLIGRGIEPRLLLPRLAESFPYRRARYIRRDSNMRVTKVVTLEKEQGRLLVRSTPVKDGVTIDTTTR